MHKNYEYNKREDDSDAQYDKDIDSDYEALLDLSHIQNPRWFK